MHGISTIIFGVTFLALLGLSISVKSHPENLFIGALLLFVADRAVVAIQRKKL